MDNKALDKQYIANTYARFPVEIVSGKGSLVYDESGKEYIDMGSGIGVTSFGMCDDEWVAAVTQQLGRFQHTSNLYYTSPCIKLAKMLCERTGMKKVFYSNSGAEANECAIKAARKYAMQNKGEEYYTIITLKNSFHGRTLTTLAATGQDAFHKLFTPLTPGFDYAEANNIDDLKAKINANKAAAVMLEVVQGEGGVIALDADYIRAVYELCRDNDIIMICDEVQTGNGRCGELYAYMHYGITPDIVTTAKGLGGGLPIGVTMLGEKVEDIFVPGDNGSTFGGNPISCAGALSILERLDDDMLADVRAKSAYIRERLQDASGIKSVSGLGLMIGIETELDSTQIVNALIEDGVLVLKAKTKIRLLPPLNTPMELIEKAVDKIIANCKLYF